MKVSVLCPGWVNTRILDSDRNRPDELRNHTTGATSSAEAEVMPQDIRQAVENGLSPHKVAEEVFNGIRQDKFYIITDEDVWRPAILKRMEDILQRRNPA